MKKILFFLIGSFFYFCIAATIRPSIPEILKKSDAVVLARVVKIEKLDARSKVVFLSNNMKFFYKKVGEKIEINFEKILISKDRYFFFLRDEPFLIYRWQLSDEWFGIEKEKEELLYLLQENSRDK